jgi:hypothetical protein
MLSSLKNLRYINLHNHKNTQDNTDVAASLSGVELTIPYAATFIGGNPLIETWIELFSAIIITVILFCIPLMHHHA